MTGQDHQLLRQLDFYQPAEWQPHSACWLAWPSHEDLWLEHLGAVQQEFTDLCKAIARSETLEILVPDQDSLQSAQDALQGLPVNFHLVAFGDIWMRDIAPIFLLGRESVNSGIKSQLATLNFTWNGWGHKYMLDGDDQVAANVSKLVDVPTFTFPWVLEGGAVEVDGLGTCLTTKQCLLNPNRNPKMDKPEIEAGLQQALGVQKILWLDQGLLNDHTDGHIDTIARFITPGVVMCMQAQDQDDPNQSVLQDIAEQLAQFTDVREQKLEVVQIPSPGLVLDPDGEIMPASYLNFYISNDSVIVPTYNSPYDQKAVDTIAAYFPQRRTIGLSAKSILLGGGAFHCITQQQPQSLVVSY